MQLCCGGVGGGERGCFEEHMDGDGCALAAHKSSSLGSWVSFRGIRGPTISPRTRSDSHERIHRSASVSEHLVS